MTCDWDPFVDPHHESYLRQLEAERVEANERKQKMLAQLRAWRRPMRILQMLKQLDIKFSLGGRGFKVDEWHFELVPSEHRHLTFIFTQGQWMYTTGNVKINAMYKRPLHWSIETPDRIRQFLMDFDRLTGKNKLVPQEPKCGRCKGTGMTPFIHRIGGVCFKCWGSGDSKNPYPKPATK